LITLTTNLPITLTNTIKINTTFTLIYPSLSLIVINNIPKSHQNTALKTFTTFFDIDININNPITNLTTITPFIKTLITLQIPNPFHPIHTTKHHQLITRESLQPKITLSLTTISYTTITSFIILNLNTNNTNHNTTTFTTLTITIILTQLINNNLPNQINPLRYTTDTAAIEIINLTLITLTTNLPITLTNTIKINTTFTLIYPSLSLIVINNIPKSHQNTALKTFTTFFDIDININNPITNLTISLKKYSTTF